ncbi:2-methoxy-6-polyprenyl-1,4-benzoquinol methylase, mitochondrial-like [Agrilus planipennis]|uniref:2-methoxy-6-polyprenyl-1,4-benzoquinol methylase, mitochondrial-like n=1 Tax=Agrilus planipennis TaxID=224129 RepID=A0A7F5RE14_AGRPL|nr:2-methoxy-6-polyprenyl-1,4-benzoquinol methylase, mitochondrial-like [Agrilus planipennis]
MSLKINRTFLKTLRGFNTAFGRNVANEQPAFKTEESTDETHFGFQKVKEGEKEHKVHKVFEDVAKSYDLMNDAMSFGIHRIWKDIFIHRLSPTENTNLLDVAGGTGDIAFRFLNYAQNSNYKNCTATICDINSAMLEEGKKRAIKLGYSPNSLSWIEGNAEKLPFNDETFTAYTIAFYEK